MELIRGIHNLRPRHRGCVATIGNYVGLREAGNLNTINAIYLFPQLAGFGIYFDAMVSLDANGAIEYMATNTSWTTIYLAVRGWFI